MIVWPRIAAAASCIAAMLTTSPVTAADVSLLSSTAMREALEELVPAFERKSGHKVTITFKSGVDVSAALRGGAQADLAVSTREALDELIKEGRLFPNSRIDFARVYVGVAVRAGAAKPDIRTPEAFRSALLAAKSIGYSKGPSGIHLESVMNRLGIFDQVKPKLKQPPLGVRVGAMVARGEVEIGVQQINELLPIPGIDFVGPLPGSLQTVLIYAVALPGTAKQVDAAGALTRFLASDAVLPVFKKLGMAPG